MSMASSGNRPGSPGSRRPGRLRRLAVTVLVAVTVSGPMAGALSALDARAAGAAGPTVLGSGSSYAAVALDQWVAQMSAFYGDNINYQTSSSVIGLLRVWQLAKTFSST